MLFKDYIGSRGTSRRSSTVSAASIFLELHSPGGSTASSPGPHRAQAAAETDFKAFKRILEAIPQQVCHCQHFPSQIVLKWFSTISERFSLPNLPGRKEMAPLFSSVPSLGLGTLKGFFELTHRCQALGAEFPGHCQEQLTQTLISSFFCSKDH